MTNTVLVRIKRFNHNHWATCGIGIRPPDHLVGEPRMKRLCTKLVPGQVVRLPSNHPLLTQKKMIEVVDGPEPDEILRPWVFASAEDAAMSNPAKSGMSVDQVRDGLAMTEGAQDNQFKALQSRREQAEAEDANRKPAKGYALEDDAGDDDYAPEFEFVDDDYAPEPEFVDDSNAANARRANNRVTRDIKDDARPVSDDEPAPAPARGAKQRRSKR